MSASKEKKMQVAQFFLTGIRLFLPCWSLDGEKQPRREATISPRVNCNYYYFFSDRKISRRLLKLFICRHLFALFIPTPLRPWRRDEHNTEKKRES